MSTLTALIAVIIAYGAIAATVLGLLGPVLGKSGKAIAWRSDPRSQIGPQLNPESESLASLVRRRRRAWTAEVLAEVLSLSRKHIYKLAKKGRMPSLRIGGAIRFDPHAIAASLESKTIE